MAKKKKKRKMFSLKLRGIKSICLVAEKERIGYLHWEYKGHFNGPTVPCLGFRLCGPSGILPPKVYECAC